jgi:hypothetical protein
VQPNAGTKVLRIEEKLLTLLTEYERAGGWLVAIQQTAASD